MVFRTTLYIISYTIKQLWHFFVFLCFPCKGITSNIFHSVSMQHGITYCILIRCTFLLPWEIRVQTLIVPVALVNTTCCLQGPIENSIDSKLNHYGSFIKSCLQPEKTAVLISLHRLTPHLKQDVKILFLTYLSHWTYRNDNMWMHREWWW